jgi:predicted alpha/beta superfamily hydrolase
VNDDASPLAATEVHYLQSEHVGDEFKIFVGHCGTATAEDPAGVLCLTDANGFFGGTVDLVRSLQLRRLVPPLLVVGIGYRAGVVAETTAVRNRDLTPTADDRFAALESALAGMGGAPALLAFVRDELLPWVAATYAADTADAAFFGHSLGGLFGTYALLHAPTTFRRYVIGSPSLWWHREAIFAMEDEYAAAHDDLRARAFFAIGADETHDGRQREATLMDNDERAVTGAWYIDMVDDLDRFVARLRSRRYASLDLHHEVFPGEFHVTVPFLTLSRGLRALYDAPR